MARIRNIKPDFFDDPGVCDLSAEAALVFIGLWPQADRAGRLPDEPRRLKIRIRPMSRCDMDAILTELHEAGFIIRYEVDNQRLIQVKNFDKHQRPHHQEPPSVFAPVPDGFGESPKSFANHPVQSAGNGDGEGDGNGEGDGEGAGAPPAPVPGIAPAWRQRSSRPTTLIQPPANHAKCFHAPAACARGVCIPAFLGRQWEAQTREQPGYIAAFVAEALANTSGPVGDDPLAWWREQWRAKHGSAKAQSPSGADAFAQVRAAMAAKAVNQ